VANDHDIHTCGCDSCESRYAQRYYGSDKLYAEAKKESKQKSLEEYTEAELKQALKRKNSK
jgi:hypothetical protein